MNKREIEHIRERLTNASDFNEVADILELLHASGVSIRDILRLAWQNGRIYGVDETKNLLDKRLS